MSRRRITANRALLVLAGLALPGLPACDKGSSGGGVGASPAPSATDAGERLAWPPPPEDAAADAPADAAPPTEVIVQHILVTYRGAKRVSAGITRTREQARARAEEALKKARTPGQDFTELVYEYSDDPEARSRMGSLGKIRRGDMTRPFEDAAFALKVGEISDVVETRFGFHVIKRNQ